MNSNVLVAMDKFRGTASAREMSEAVASAVQSMGLAADVQPMSDGGEGFRDAVVGDVEVVDVAGPLGERVEASVTFVTTSHGRRAVIEVADAVGRQLLKNPAPHQALAAQSGGVGELILAAARLGASEVVVGCGGSATSDGGLGCYQVLREAGGLPIPVIAATDIDALFSGARRYAAQKGVRSEDLLIIDERLSSIRDRYLNEQGVDVELLERAGAAGGIAGALASLGATLVSGFDAVSSAVGLPERIESAQLVITGEGRFDSGSLEGKVTVGMAQLAAGRTPVLVVCGSVDDDAAAIFSGRFPNSSIASLERRFGLEIALNQVLDCAAVVVKESLQN